MLADDGISGFQASFADGALGRSEALEVEGMPFERAIRITTRKRPKKPWGIQLSAGVRARIEKGDVCLLAFWVRGRPLGENALLGHAGVQAFVQRRKAPFEKIARSLVAVNKPWLKVHVPFIAETQLPAGEIEVTFHTGYDPQTVEFGGVELINYGANMDLGTLPKSEFSYVGRDPDAPWRSAAAERIERIRKADLTVRVVDRDRQPVEGASVRVRMKRHTFGFGSAVRANWLCRDSEDGRKYRQIVEQNYNKVTVENALKPKWWPVVQSNTHGMFRKEWTDRALAWLNERDIEVRGHCITWAILGEREVAQYRDKPEQLRKELFAHMQERVSEVGKRVGEWDVVNHIVIGDTSLATLLGGDSIYAEVVKRSRLLAPHAELWLNEGAVLHRGSQRDKYAKMTQYLIDSDAPPDGIGFMAHFRPESFLTPPQRLYDVFERFAKIIPDLQLTELDVRTGNDEQLQADYLRDVMIVAFSHPAVQAIVMWGFWEGNHWKPEAALYRRDWSIKPAGQAWRALVFKEWWTDETGQTGRDGVFKTRGFLGDYEIGVTHRGVSKEMESALAAEGASLVVPLH